MIVGILSDSHGRHLAVRKAMALFDRLGVGHVIHCGDIGGIPVFDEMIGRPLTFVWGNMDFPDRPLLAYLETAELEPLSDDAPVVSLGGRKFAVFHGHESNFQRSIENLEADYVLHGHTHVARDERLAGKRVINPGALHRARVKTVATLDTNSDRLEFHELDV